MISLRARRFFGATLGSGSAAMSLAAFERNVVAPFTPNTVISRRWCGNHQDSPRGPAISAVDDASAAVQATADHSDPMADVTTGTATAVVLAVGPLLSPFRRIVTRSMYNRAMRLLRTLPADELTDAAELPSDYWLHSVQARRLVLRLAAAYRVPPNTFLSVEVAKKLGGLRSSAIVLDAMTSTGDRANQDETNSRLLATCDVLRNGAPVEKIDESLDLIDRLLREVDEAVSGVLVVPAKVLIALGTVLRRFSHGRSSLKVADIVRHWSSVTHKAFLKATDTEQVRLMEHFVELSTRREIYAYATPLSGLLTRSIQSSHEISPSMATVILVTCNKLVYKVTQLTRQLRTTQSKGTPTVDTSQAPMASGALSGAVVDLICAVAQHPAVSDAERYQDACDFSDDAKASQEFCSLCIAVAEVVLSLRKGQAARWVDGNDLRDAEDELERLLDSPWRNPALRAVMKSLRRPDAADTMRLAPEMTQQLAKVAGGMPFAVGVASLARRAIETACGARGLHTDLKLSAIDTAARLAQFPRREMQASIVAALGRTARFCVHVPDSLTARRREEAAINPMEVMSYLERLSRYLTVMAHVPRSRGAPLDRIEAIDLPRLNDVLSQVLLHPEAPRQADALAKRMTLICARLLQFLDATESADMCTPVGKGVEALLGSLDRVIAIARRGESEPCSRIRSLPLIALPHLAADDRVPAQLRAAATAVLLGHLPHLNAADLALVVREFGAWSGRPASDCDPSDVRVSIFSKAASRCAALLSASDDPRRTRTAWTAAHTLLADMISEDMEFRDAVDEASDGKAWRALFGSLKRSTTFDGWVYHFGILARVDPQLASDAVRTLRSTWMTLSRTPAARPEAACIFLSQLVVLVTPPGQEGEQGPLEDDILVDAVDALAEDTLKRPTTLTCSVLPLRTLTLMLQCPYIRSNVTAFQAIVGQSNRFACRAATLEDVAALAGLVDMVGPRSACGVVSRGLRGSRQVLEEIPAELAFDLAIASVRSPLTDIAKNDASDFDLPDLTPDATALPEMTITRAQFHIGLPEGDHNEDFRLVTLRARLVTILLSNGGLARLAPQASLRCVLKNSPMADEDDAEVDEGPIDSGRILNAVLTALSAPSAAKRPDHARRSRRDNDAPYVDAAAASRVNAILSSALWHAAASRLDAVPAVGGGVNVDEWAALCRGGHPTCSVAQALRFGPKLTAAIQSSLIAALAVLDDLSEPKSRHDDAMQTLADLCVHIDTCGFACEEGVVEQWRALLARRVHVATWVSWPPSVLLAAIKSTTCSDADFTTLSAAVSQNMPSISVIGPVLRDMWRRGRSRDVPRDDTPHNSASTRAALLLTAVTSATGGLAECNRWASFAPLEELTTVLSIAAWVANRAATPGHEGQFVTTMCAALRLNEWSAWEAIAEGLAGLLMHREPSAIVSAMTPLHHIPAFRVAFSARPPALLALLARVNLHISNHGTSAEWRELATQRPSDAAIVAAACIAADCISASSHHVVSTYWIEPNVIGSDAENTSHFLEANAAPWLALPPFEDDVVRVTVAAGTVAIIEALRWLESETAAMPEGQRNRIRTKLLEPSNDR